MVDYNVQDWSQHFTDQTRRREWEGDDEKGEIWNSSYFNWKQNQRINVSTKSNANAHLLYFDVTIKNVHRLREQDWCKNWTSTNAMNVLCTK